eukprot:12477157-Alexandrium_andersonii.AAC.1
MSASFVGSEMCIRDSSRACSAGHPAAPRGRLCHPPEAPSTGVQTAVSYTHLTLPTICSV